MSEIDSRTDKTVFSIKQVFLTYENYKSQECTNHKNIIFFHQLFKFGSIFFF